MLPNKEKHEVLDEKKILQVLDALYDKSLNGVPKVSRSVDEIVDDYLARFETAEQAAKSLIRYQIAKCGTSGFLTGLGGVLTLPVAIPANVSSVMYVQLRMIAAIAKMGDYDIRSDQVQTLAYACLTGSAMSDVLKEAGIKFGEKFARAGIKKIPSETIKRINQKVGFRFITKFGETGVINLGKMIPLVGGVIGATSDISATKLIGVNAYRVFIKGQMPVVENDIVFIDTDNE